MLQVLNASRVVIQNLVQESLGIPKKNVLETQT